MMNLRFEFKDQSVEESTKILKYSDHKTYNTIVHDLSKTVDDIIYEGGVSYNKIKNSKIDEIPSIYSVPFQIEASDYIAKHNEELTDGTSKTEIRYEIRALNDDASFEYVKYVNDKEVERGSTWYHRLESKADKKAFIKAIKKFRSENGVRGPLWKIKKVQKEIDEAINSLDDWIPDIEMPDPPLVEIAAMEILTDPCKFLADLKHASNVAITRMYGVIPNPQEVLTYTIKYATSTACQLARKLVSSITPIVKSVASPITEQLPSFDDPDNLDNGDNVDYYNSFSGYMDQVDALNEEQRKKDSEVYATYEMMDYEIKQKVITQVQTNIGGTANEMRGRGGSTFKRASVGILVNHPDFTERCRFLTNGNGMRNSGAETAVDSKSLCASYVTDVTIKIKRFPDGETMYIKIRGVNKFIAQDFVSIFNELYNIGYMIKWSGGGQKKGAFDKSVVTNHYAETTTDYCGVQVYNYRQIRNTGGNGKVYLSPHSYGVAVDINPPDNWYGSAQSDDIPYEFSATNKKSIMIRTENNPVVKIFEKYGWGWGGMYRGGGCPYDFMHFSAHGR